MVAGTNTSDFSISCDRKFDRGSLKEGRVYLGSSFREGSIHHGGEAVAEFRATGARGQDSSLSIG